MINIDEAAWLIEEFVEFTSFDKTNDQGRLRNILRIFEKDIREDEQLKFKERVKELELAIDNVIQGGGNES